MWRNSKLICPLRGLNIICRYSDDDRLDEQVRGEREGLAVGSGRAVGQVEVDVSLGTRDVGFYEGLATKGGDGSSLLSVLTVEQVLHKDLRTSEEELSTRAITNGHLANHRIAPRLRKSGISVCYTSTSSRHLEVKNTVRHTLVRRDYELRCTTSQVSELLTELVVHYARIGLLLRVGFTVVVSIDYLPGTN